MNIEERLARYEERNTFTFEYRIPYSTTGSEVIYTEQKKRDSTGVLGFPHRRMLIAPPVDNLVHAKPRGVVKVVYDSRRNVWMVFLNGTIHKPKPRPHRKPISNRERKMREDIEEFLEMTKSYLEGLVKSGLPGTSIPADYDPYDPINIKHNIEDGLAKNTYLDVYP
jgi:hypothetical protein